LNIIFAIWKWANRRKLPAEKGGQECGASMIEYYSERGWWSWRIRRSAAVILAVRKSAARRADFDSTNQGGRREINF